MLKLKHFVATFSLLVLVLGQPQYQIVINQTPEFQHIFGRENQLVDGSCCASYESSPPCRGACFSAMTDICLREIDHPINDQPDFNNCSLGATTYGFYDFGTTIFYSTTDALTTFYPEGFQLLFRIRSSDNLIDSGVTTIIAPITNRGNPIYHSYTLDGEHNVATLLVDRLAVVCRDGYTGSDCSTKFCIPRDDVRGHYTCNMNMDKVCLPGYQNPETNCVQREFVETTSEIPSTQTEYTSQLIDESASTSVRNSSAIAADVLLPEEERLSVKIAAGVGAGALFLLLLILTVLIVFATLHLRTRFKYKGNQGARPPTTEANNSSGFKQEDSDMEINEMYNRLHISSIPVGLIGAYNSEDSGSALYVEIIAGNPDTEQQRTTQCDKHSENIYENVV